MRAPDAAVGEACEGEGKKKKRKKRKKKKKKKQSTVDQARNLPDVFHSVTKNVERLF